MPSSTEMGLAEWGNTHPGGDNENEEREGGRKSVLRKEAEVNSK